MPIKNLFLLVAAGLSVASVCAADFKVDGIQQDGARTEISFANTKGYYYILWRGNEPTAIQLPADLVLGDVPPNLLAHTNATDAAQFYRVEKLPRTSLRDTDGDGICDVWELIYRHTGAALNPYDAQEDHDGNGVPDATDALRERLREGAVRGRPVLAAGSTHSLAIRRDGTLWGWGDNLYGQLGSSLFTETNVPAQIGSDTNWLAVSAARFISYGLKQDGTMWYWGQTSTGNVSFPTQFGPGTNWVGLPTMELLSLPTALKADNTRYRFNGLAENFQTFDGNDWAAVCGLTDWAIKLDGTLWRGIGLVDTNWASSTLCEGVTHTLVLRADGSLIAWNSGGNAFDGQLGLGNTAPTTPTQVGTQKWAAIAAGTYHSVGIQSDGTLWWWGVNRGFAPSGNGFLRTNVPTQFGTNTDWLALSARDEHTLALRADGTVWTFGLNALGKLGNATTPLLKEPTQIGTATDWSAIAAGYIYSFGLKTNGTLWAWGGNPYGTLGVGDFNFSSQVRQVPGSNWLAISGGGDHSVGLQSDGSLWHWGKIVYTNQPLADLFTNQPARLGTDTDWVKISAGWQHSLAGKANRSLWAWGRNVNGSLGNNDFSLQNQNLPVAVSGGMFWTNFSAGYYSSFGVSSASSHYFWGRPVGSGFGNFVSPQIMSGPSFGWRFLANGKSHLSSSHALALRHDGTLWSWGGNSFGQLGRGGDTSVPTVVGTDTNWSHIAVGDVFSGALRTDGTLWMTGSGYAGQLGLGTRYNTNLFTRVGTGTNWTSLALGQSHAVALRADGTLWAWGDNSDGQCAQPALFDPAPVPGTNWGRPE